GMALLDQVSRTAAELLSDRHSAAENTGIVWSLKEMVQSVGGFLPNRRFRNDASSPGSNKASSKLDGSTDAASAPSPTYSSIASQLTLVKSSIASWYD